MSLPRREHFSSGNLRLGHHARYRLLLLLIAIFAGCLSARSENANANFDAANNLYEQGKFSEALAGYDQLIESGHASEAVLFNRGNALFKLGRLGQAITSYRSAALIDPRDFDLCANLQLARTRARGGTPYRADPWLAWLGRLTFNEWTCLTVGATWVLFILLAIVQWRPELGSLLRKYIFAAAGAAIVLVACLTMVLKTGYYSRSAIVVAGEADVRHGPFDDSPSLFKVRDGVELEVLDQRDNWIQVAYPSQPIGWLRRDQTLIFDPKIPPGAKL